MIKHGHLNVPVMGRARSAKKVDDLRARVRISLEEHGGLDAAASSPPCSSRLIRTRALRSSTFFAERARPITGTFRCPCLIMLYAKPGKSPGLSYRPARSAAKN